MQTKVYHTIDKSSWPIGVWKNEPDKMQYQDEKTKLPIIIKRNQHLGFLCGYVGIDSTHPAYGLNYDNEILNDINIHGGLTYADLCEHVDEAIGICHLPDENETTNIWWLGFDCGHYMDFAPNFPHSRFQDQIYRDINYVKVKCENLAKQLKEMKSE